MQSQFFITNLLPTEGDVIAVATPPGIDGGES